MRRVGFSITRRGNMYRCREYREGESGGWYSTGPKIENDLDIGELFGNIARIRCWLSNLSPTADDAPTNAYRAVLDVKEEAERWRSAEDDEHVTCIEASDPEAIGVEHLLRDVKDATVSTLSTQVKEKASVERIGNEIKEIKNHGVGVERSVPVNQRYWELQNAFNGLPNLNLSYVKAFAVETNDAQLMICSRRS